MSIEDKGDNQSQFRVRKYEFADKGLSKKEYHKKWYDANKEKLKISNVEQKEQLKERSKVLQQKYRESYRLLKQVYQANFNPTIDIIEKIKNIVDD
jgi:hypothetical protein